MNDKIDVTPVYAKIQGRGGDHRLQRVRSHGIFDLAPLSGIERAVVKRDGQVQVIDMPEFLKQQLGLPTRIDKHD